MTNPPVSHHPPFYDEAAAINLIRELGKVRGSHETVVRQTLVAGLSDVFPAADRPWWVERHIRGAEQHLTFSDQGQTSGYADSVVGSTAIEYEANLTDTERFKAGKHQVHQYCAGLLNTGADPSKIRGILSDGIEWHAYELVNTLVNDLGDYSVLDVELKQIGTTLDCHTSDAATARKLVAFLTEHLGREGTRPLTAISVAEYLGFDGGFGRNYLKAFEEIVLHAMASDKQSADLIEHLWTTFVSHLSVDSGVPSFDISTYTQEFYLATLAKLMCANVIARQALMSEKEELDSILSGVSFEAKGLHRLVEHDYFGWLASSVYLDQLRPFAQMIQQDLAAFDFTRPPKADLFGELVAVLAQRTQRQLLGQEWTPKIIADEMAGALFDRLEDGIPPRFVDMCCGSGSMLVAVTDKTREWLAEMGITPADDNYLGYLENACAGFDIDPLAVILAKINWVQTNRAVLEPLDGSRVVSLPVYHADSLFSVSPVFEDPMDSLDLSADPSLHLFDTEMKLPRFLLQPERQTLFDFLLDGAHGLSLELASTPQQSPDAGHIDQILDDAQVGTSDNALDPDEIKATQEFLKLLIPKLADFKRNGRDGIWTFVIRNAYRPALVAGQFNGIISNPPWLSMSKIGNNPFASVLKNRAARYLLEPPGSSFLHLEMATVFLAHSIEHYLADGGHIACVLPDTIRTGGQHLPFRTQVAGQQETQQGVELRLDEMWTVKRGTFKNRAVIVLGTKAAPDDITEIPGQLVPRPNADLPYYVVRAGNRLVWSASPQGDGIAGAYLPGFASQGADIMPRRLVFFNTNDTGDGRCTISPIQRDSANWYLWSNAKKHCQFLPTTRTIPDRFVHPVYLSKHLAPFALADPSLAVLPVTYQSGRWCASSSTAISLNANASAHFDAIIEESDFRSLSEFWTKGIDYRSKLRRQSANVGSWIALYGAGGGIPAAAYFRIVDDKPPIIDQTLYWAECRSEEEAIYFCGVINSQALLSRIADLMPGGEFGDRHLHTLPTLFIPEFDPTNAQHAYLVECTHSLLVELRDLANHDLTIASYFTTKTEMTIRRRRLRKELTYLDSYHSYSNACEDLFG